MKKIFLFISLNLPLIFCFSQNNNPYLTGNWMGSLQVGKENLQIGVSIDEDFNPEKSYFISPDQGVMHIAIKKIIQHKDSIIIQAKDIAASFKGQLNSTKDTLKGKWYQGKSLALNFTKVEKLPGMNRPQNPVKPYNYVEESVSFTEKKSGIALAGTLTLPQGKGPFPAVILVSGSGPQNRDEELLGHKPFLVLSDYLTNHGIAVLRYDDRGVGESQGRFDTATTFDFANDAEAAVNFLLSDARIDKGKVGIIGHSEGGMIAPIVASRNSQVAFIVLMAGPGMSGKEILLEQNKLIAKASGMADPLIQKLYDLNKKLYAIAAKEKNDKRAIDQMKNVIEKEWKKFSTEDLAASGMDKKNLVMAVYQLETPWMRTFLSFEPKEYLKKVHCPVLALNGSLDMQVPADADLSAIQEILKKAGNNNVTVKKFDKLNHLFQHAGTGSPDEYAHIEETISPEVLEFISSWILEQKK